MFIEIVQKIPKKMQTKMQFMQFVFSYVVATFYATKWYNFNNRGCKPTVRSYRNIISPERVEFKPRSSTPTGLGYNKMLIHSTGFTRGYSYSAS
jgi:hypothetical protein